MIAKLVDWFRWRLGPKASIDLPLAPWVPTKDSGTTHTIYDLEFSHTLSVQGPLGLKEFFGKLLNKIKNTFVV